MGYRVCYIVAILVIVKTRCSELDQQICNDASDMFQGSGGQVSMGNQTDNGNHSRLEWSSYCKTKRSTWNDTRSNLIEISCAIGEDTPLWRFKDFQYWRKDNNYIKYKLRLICSPGGGVSLPWPMRAYHLVHLEVRNCNIVDFYLDSINESIASIPDELEVIIIDSCVIQLDICHLEVYTDNYYNFTRDFFCGPELLRKYVATNVSSAFTGNTRPWIDYLEYLHRVAIKYLTVSRLPLYTDCVYGNLEIRDESVDSDRSAYSLQTLVAGKKFPQLKLFNISHTRIRKIRMELQDWQLYFPKLEYLDISWNAIETFSFVDHLSVVVKPLFVNLQHNNITVISNSTIFMLMKLKSTTVDIRDNPFICDCELLEFWNLLNSNSMTMHAEFDYYRYFYNLTCDSPSKLHDRRISSLAWYELCPDNEQDIILTSALVSVVVFVLLGLLVILGVARCRHRRCARLRTVPS